MPVRSLNSPVLTWPRADEVDGAVRDWAVRIATSRPELLRAGYFGSYARGDAGVGSDLDIIVVAESAPRRFELRRKGWRTTTLPVPVDLLVYTQDEFDRLRAGGRFARVLSSETVWVYIRDQSHPAAASR